LNGRDQAGYCDGFFDEGAAVLEQLFLQLTGFLGLCELAFQMLTKLPFAFPGHIAERALEAVDELEPLFDEGAALHCGQQRRVGIEPA
jgi:hypothetical protein